MRLVIFAVVLLAAGCAANRDGQQAQIGTRDVLPNARNISPDTDARGAHVGTHAEDGGTVVQVDGWGWTDMAIVAAIVAGFWLMYRSTPPGTVQKALANGHAK